MNIETTEECKMAPNQQPAEQEDEGDQISAKRRLSQGQSLPGHFAILKQVRSWHQL